MATTIAAPTAGTVSGLSTLAQEILPVLYQHRLLSTSQLQTLLQPHTATARYLRRQLAALREQGLVSSLVQRRGGRGELLSYVTPLGREVVEASGEVTPRAYRVSGRAAAGQLQAHTLAVNDVGLAFVAGARHLGHECGPMDWVPEIAHRLRDGKDRLSDRAFLIPDAVVRYTRAEGSRRELLAFFVELDRGTEHPGVLVEKVAAYCRYRHYRPAGDGGRTGRGDGEAWRGRYPAFPHLLIVLADKPEQVLARRTADVRALLAADPVLANTARRLAGGITTLSQLQQQGLDAPIVTPLSGSSAPVSVLPHVEGMEIPR